MKTSSRSFLFLSLTFRFDKVCISNCSLLIFSRTNRKASCILFLTVILFISGEGTPAFTAIETARVAVPRMN